MRLIGALFRALAPIETADPAAEKSFSSRLAALIKSIPAPDSDTISSGDITPMTSARRETSDSVHLLVMDMHQAINRRQPGKTQEGIQVGCRHLLFASDIVHGQLGVLDQTRLDVVSARNDSEQARISGCLFIGILDQHSHFATDALQAHRNRQPQHIVRSIRWCLMLHRQINRPGEQLGQSASRQRDVDAIRSDFHAAKQCHERLFDFVWCGGSEFFRDLTATFD
jgi:hypothetical protein